ncbi:MAG: hypothetical protein NTZ68_02285 [Candidatus Dependentiae bacterium]|nr:hypothetical protein [Candidatus Dependentiae bacterium]
MFSMADAFEVVGETAEDAAGNFLKKTEGETAEAFADRIAKLNADLVGKTEQEASKIAAEAFPNSFVTAETDEALKIASQNSSEGLFRSIAKQAREGAIAEAKAIARNAAAESARRGATGIIDKVAVQRVADTLSVLNDAELEVSKANDAIINMGKKLKSVGKDLAKAMKNNDVAGMNAAKSEMKAAKDALVDATSSLKGQAATDMVTAAGDKADNLLVKMDKTFAEAGGTFAADGTLKSMASFSDEAAASLDKSMDDYTSQIIKDSASAQKNAMDAINTARDAATKGLTDAETLAAKFKSKSLLQDATRFKNGITEGLGKAGSAIADALPSAGEAGMAVLRKLGAAGELLISAVLFMVPNIFESSFLAQKQRQVQLQTLAQPIQFGDWVLQIPDSCFNWTNPSATLPIYVRIPVANVNDTISEDDMKRFLISGSGSTADYSINPKPQTTNTVSTKIQNGGARLFSFGTDMDMQPISRYVIKESSYYPHSGIVTSFAPPASYTPPASSALTSSQFTGLVVDLNSGYVMDASGEANSPMFLIAPIDPHNPNYQPSSPASVKDFLPSELSKLEMSGNKITYTQYADVGQGSAGAVAAPSLRSQFDCKCIGESEENGAMVANGDVSTCKTDPTNPCLLSKSLAAYKSGLSIETPAVAGVAAVPATATTAAIPAVDAVDAVPGIGSVIPMFGWGTTLYDTIISPANFPGFSAPTGSITLLPNASSKTAEAVYADLNTNYAAQGCQVYICANTPFAKALQAQQGGSAANSSASRSFVDYIIFLDDQGNQVPLQVPTIPKDSTLKWPKIGLNPAVKYWASLVSGETTLYDLQGNAAATDPGLGGTSGIVATAIAELSQSQAKTPTFPLLGAQFAAHSQAMLAKYSQGPFSYGHAKLTLSDKTISVPGAAGAPASTVNLYEGSYCFASQGAQSQVKDLLVAQDNAGDAGVQLPDPSVVSFYSLVTDIGYTVQKDGSLQVTDFSQAPVTKSGKTYKLNKSAKNTFTLFTEIAGATATIPDYLIEMRDAWWANFDPSAQAQGFNVGKLAFKLAHGLPKTAVASKCFIYEVSPSPSAALTNQDLYVIVKSSSPAIATLNPMNATSATKDANLVSLLTGYLYDTQGNPVLDSNDKHQKISAPAGSNKMRCQLIQDALTTKFPVITGTDFQTQYTNFVNAYAAQMQTPMGPYSFGELHLGIYAGDLYEQKYVYFTAAGMHKPQASFEPTDMFVTIDGYPNSPIVGQTPLSSNTKNVMSLITGQVYDATGVVGMMTPISSLFTFTDSSKGDWSLWIQDNLNQLQAIAKARVAAQQAEQKELDADEAQAPESADLMTADSVLAIINRLTPSGLKGLPAPYQTLKFDPLKKSYVRVSPASDTDPNDLLYQFFNVPNQKVPTGAIYKVGGSTASPTVHQVRVVQDPELQATKDMYGIVVNADGIQSLGVPLLTPSLLMKEDDKALTGRNSGSTMYVSTDSNFPGENITLPNGYHMYFSKLMGTYYVYETKGKRNQWISVSGGNLYEKDGTPVKLKQKVAIVAGKKGVDDMILLYENNAGYMQGYMSDGADYKNVNSTDGSMSWMAMSSPYNVLTVTNNKAKTSYTVGKKSYSVNPDFSWNPLFVVPIDASGKLLSPTPPSSYADAQLVSKSGNISHIIYGQKMYKAVAAAKGSTAPLTMVPVSGDASKTITISSGVDGNTKAPFITVSDGTHDYKYGFISDQLDDTQLASYQTQIWKGDVVACPFALPVGPYTTKKITISGNSVSVSVPDESTHALFVQNINNVGGLKALNSASSIVGAPTSPTDLNLLGLNLGRIYSSASGRYFGSIAPSDGTASTFTYFADGGYADLQTGALFDNTGMSVGYSLALNDFLSVLNKLQVTVTKNSTTGKNQLAYRSGPVVDMQTAALAAAAKAPATPAAVTATGAMA